MNRIFTTVELRRTAVEGRHLDDLPEMLREDGMFSAAQEMFWVVAFDAGLNVQAAATVAMGDSFGVKVSIPAVMQVLHASGASRFYVGHNHPAGNVRPTDKDLQLTNIVMAAASVQGCYLEDHWVIGPNEKIWSMRDKGQLEPSPKILELYAEAAAGSPFELHKHRGGSR